jgi:hypothetical protein
MIFWIRGVLGKGWVLPSCEQTRRWRLELHHAHLQNAKNCHLQIEPGLMPPNSDESDDNLESLGP